MSAHSSIVSYFEQNVEFTYAARPRANGTDADPDTTILFPKDTLECSISKDSYRGSTYVEDRERSSIYSACSLSKHVDEVCSKELLPSAQERASAADLPCRKKQPSSIPSRPGLGPSG